jgi:hypothetical protein
VSIPEALLEKGDYWGIVLETGKGITQFSQGDRICGSVHGGNSPESEYDVFADEIVVKEY